MKTEILAARVGIQTQKETTEVRKKSEVATKHRIENTIEAVEKLKDLVLKLAVRNVHHE